ncbi:hypothetical protein GCM10011351_24550 [Paraliobacillus quinghaiensis]|uniref:Uncharacterized protein n=1 Tax=Paraliobacillus quinghaiensis TaxID=470815 RepID=A0A917TTH1_9BACI|nr:hypothetical protein [Paraliobacillus quinghaiensis]GGM37423.1 hypothetical protein GCM10011351_24550 [Paraliobacillus quinghaiensis]
MHKFMFVFLLSALFVLGGFSSSSGEIVKEIEINNGDNSVDLVTSNEKSDMKIIEGVDTVLKSVGALQFTVNNSPEAIEKLNKLGEKLDDDWDIIEEKVEKQFPKDYKNIEDSLYPLIDQAQSDKPNIEEIKQLIKDVNVKLNKFKEKISS